jgi:cbb3-type cytochrome oxidase subunit 3
MMAPPAVPVTEPSSGPRLRDIHLPPDPAWWPPAPGWWVLAALILLSLLIGAWRWRRYRRARFQRQHVLLELDQLALRHQRGGDTAELATGLHQLLRRVARQHDALAAKQRGDAWQRTLARMPVDAATLDILLALDQQIYRADVAFDHAAAVTAVRQWLRLALKPAAWKRTAKVHADA